MASKDLHCDLYPSCPCTIDEVCNAEIRLNLEYQRGLAEGREQARKAEGNGLSNLQESALRLRIELLRDRLEFHLKPFRRSKEKCEQALKDYDQLTADLLRSYVPQVAELRADWQAQLTALEKELRVVLGGRPEALRRVLALVKR